MKKYILTFVALMACMFVATSCSNDDVDDPAKFEFIEPCLEWDANQTDVDKFQSKLGSDWSKGVGQDGISYANNRKNMVHVYQFGKDSKLCSAQVHYTTYSAENFTAIKNFITTKYNAELKPVYASVEMYMAEVAINNHDVEISLINYNNSFMVVMYDDKGEIGGDVDNPEYLQGMWKSTSVISGGVPMANEFYIEFKGNKAKSDFDLSDREYFFSYGNGHLKLTNDGRETDFTIIRFTKTILEVSYTDRIFNQTVVIKFQKQ